MLHTVMRFVAALKTAYRSGAAGREAAAVLMVAVLLTPPPALGVQLADDSVSAIASARWLGFLTSAFGPSRAAGSQGRSGGMPQLARRPTPAATSPRRPPSRAELEAKVAGLQLNVRGQTQMYSTQRKLFSAVPLDEQGNSVQGLSVRWESSDPSVVSVTEDGQAVAGAPGVAVLVARGGQRQASVSVKVDAFDKEKSNQLKLQLERERLNRKRRAERAGGEVTVRKASWSPGDAATHAGRTRGKSARFVKAAAFQEEEPPYDPYADPRNDVGLPPGRTEPGAAEPPAAVNGTETPGSANFFFNVPLLSLAGRGQSNVALNLSYNSRVWTAYYGESGIDQIKFSPAGMSFPAPGFNLDFGRVYGEGMGVVLVEPNGTRRALGRRSLAGAYIEERNFFASDGSQIHYHIAQDDFVYGLKPDGTYGYVYIYEGVLTYPDGTRVHYDGNYSPPYKIVDRNGNYILITYDGELPATIKDSLGRYVRFHYGPQTPALRRQLLSITAPGYDGGPDRQLVRFYYQDIPLVNTSFFNSYGWNNSQGQPGLNVISHIYFPGTGSGYKYEYSAYGMIYRIKKQRGMTVSTTDLSQAGQVTGEGETAAWTLYDYPVQEDGALQDVPKYTRRTDDWAGRTAGMSGTNEAPYYTFATDAGLGTSTVTAPDGTVTESTTNPLTGHVMTVKVSKDGALLRQTTTEWATLTGPRCENCIFQPEWKPQSVGVTDETGKTKRTVFGYELKTIPYTTYYMLNNNPAYSYTSDYYCLKTVSERGYDDAELRRTETTYEESLEYVKDRRLLYLPKTVKTFAGGSNTPATRVEYAYDLETLTPRTGILMHDGSVGAFRGNVTNVTTYADAAAGALPTTDTMTHDVAGNVVTATADCCQLKSYDYAADYQYAFPTSVTRGDTGQLTTHATYDRNTGLLRSSTDENDQQTVYHYYADTLRLFKEVAPDGGYVRHDYVDGLHDDPTPARRHSYVFTKRTGPNGQGGDGREVLSWQFFDGRGAVARTFVQTGTHGQPDAYVVRDIEYDVMGRQSRTSNPYYNANGSQGAINPSDKWVTTSYDDLGRVVRVTRVDGVVGMSAEYGDTPTPVTDADGHGFRGSVVTTTDAAGRKRRSITDAMGHMRRVDEPDADNVLGPLAAPKQATHYKYDSRGRLIKITQGEQTRYFKYDSLGRMTHQRHVEQDAPHGAADPLTGNNSWSSYGVYNGHGLLTDFYDARGVHTQIGYDGLNRIQQITYSDGTPKVTYTYDQASAGHYNKGRLTEVKTDAAGAATPQTVQSYKYDRMGRVTDHRQTVGDAVYAMGYGYNELGHLSTQTYPSGRVVSYEEDAKGLLRGVSDNTRAYVSGMTYGAHGGLLSETLGNGATNTLEYNDHQQIEEIRVEKAGAVLQRFDYKYGEVDLDTGAVDETKNTGLVARLDSYIGAAKQWEQRFRYDELGRLSKFGEYRGDDGQMTYKGHYTYDRYANRYQQGEGNQNLPHIPVADGDIVKARNRFASGVTYDEAGNIKVDTKFRARKYVYDANGRQKSSANLDDTGPATAVHDGVGQRVQVSEAGVVRNFVHDIFGRVVAEYGGPGGPLTAVKYVTSDRQGSTRAVLDNQGRVVERLDYLPFGGKVSAGTGQRTSEQGYASSSSVRQQYAGMERDGGGHGLDHTPWRKFDSLAGRWTTPDPYGGSMELGDPQTTNRYAYVNNDPVNRVDPSGLDDEEEEEYFATIYATLPDPLLAEEIYRMWDTIFGYPLTPFDDDNTGLPTGDPTTTDPQIPQPRPTPTPEPPIYGPCGWEEERDMREVAAKIGAQFHVDGKWAFKMDQSIKHQDVMNRLKSAGFSMFIGAHSGDNFEGNVNGRWYHLSLSRGFWNSDMKLDHHFEVSKPSSWAHKKDWASGRASKWQRPSEEECERSKKNAK